MVYLFSQLGYIENYATGFEKTNTAYAPYEQKPVYTPFDHFFLVTLPNVNYYLFDVDDNKEISVNQKNYELTEQEQIIIDYIKQCGSIRRFVVEDILDVKQRRANNVLKELVSKGILKSEGQARAIKYYLV